MKKIFLLLTVILSLGVTAKGVTAHCDEDIAMVNNLLTLLKASEVPTGDRMVLAAKALVGAGEDDYYLTDTIGNLRINVDSFTPLMFVNNLVALTKASRHPGNVNETTFFQELENIACRRGENKGFQSIMYHGADWIADNISRGNITELTENYDFIVPRTKSLDEMTRKRKDFAALNDSMVFESVRMTEMGFRTHRIPTLKKESIKKKEIDEDLRNGDIIILVPNRDGIDIYDMGIISLEEGVPYLIHLSPKLHEVVIEKEDLSRYMALMTKYFQGYRLLRLNE